MSAPSLPAVEYRGADVAVRDDLRECHASLLEHLRRPGCWFTGAERLAIAAESRQADDCPSCRERKAALSPEHPQGAHTRATATPLPDAAVEIAHRVRSDSGRLSRAWFDRQLASGLAVGPYVEAVGVTAFVAGLDAFCRALGVAALPLPDAVAGEPSRHTPAHLRDDIAWVPILTPEDASGPEADLYHHAPIIPNIARALSSVPGHVRLLQEETASHYLSLADMADPTKGRALDRPQMELVAARVSALNECFY